MAEKNPKHSKIDIEPRDKKAIIAKAEDLTQTTLNSHCPCKRNCIRHGNCEECRTIHAAEGKYPTCCQRIANRRKRQKQENT